MRHFIGKQLLIASGNKGKVSEIQELLAPFAVEVIPASQYAIEEPEETGNSFEANAQLKAAYYGEKTGLPALADDSGLSVDLLNGAPGIYSARWAEGKDFSIAFNRILNEIKAIDEEYLQQEIRAHFVCVLALWWPDGHMETIEGKVNGKLQFPPKGEKGFGYDPIFIPDGYQHTFAEMEPEIKHTMSHRANAFRKLVEQNFYVACRHSRAGGNP